MSAFKRLRAPISGMFVKVRLFFALLSSYDEIIVLQVNVDCVGIDLLARAFSCVAGRAEVIADRMASGMAAALQRRAAKRARLDARTTAVLVVSGMFIKVRLFLLCYRIMTIENCVAGEFGCALGYQWISIA